MNYLLMILSGLLGIFGVLKETHKEVKEKGQKKKVITNWGIVTLIALFCILCLSIYKTYEDNKAAERIAKENEYLKLSEITIGPYYYFKIKFKDSLFQTDGWKIVDETRNAQKELYKWYNGLDSSYKNNNLIAAMSKSYDGNFFDSLSRNSLFQNRSYITNSRTNLARLNFHAGILDGYIDFENDGLVIPMFRFEDLISRVISGAQKDSMDKIHSNFSYDKDELFVKGQFPRSLRAGTIYGSILREFEAKKNSSYFEIFFNKQPSNNEINNVNLSFKKIKDIQFIISYDPDAIRWLIIPFKIESDYKVVQRKESGIVVWGLSKKITYENLPYIGDISK